MDAVEVHVQVCVVKGLFSHQVVFLNALLFQYVLLFQNTIIIYKQPFFNLNIIIHSIYQPIPSIYFNLNYKK